MNDFEEMKKLIQNRLNEIAKSVWDDQINLNTNKTFSGIQQMLKEYENKNITIQNTVVPQVGDQFDCCGELWEISEIRRNCLDFRKIDDPSIEYTYDILDFQKEVNNGLLVPINSSKVINKNTNECEYKVGDKIRAKDDMGGILKDMIYTIHKINIDNTIDIIDGNFRYWKYPPSLFELVESARKPLDQVFDQMEKTNVGEFKCNHKWKHYHGFAESYDYCEICDEKKNITKWGY